MTWAVILRQEPSSSTTAVLFIFLLIYQLSLGHVHQFLWTTSLAASDTVTYSLYDVLEYISKECNYFVSFLTASFILSSLSEKKNSYYWFILFQLIKIPRSMRLADGRRNFVLHNIRCFVDQPKWKEEKSVP